MGPSDNKRTQSELVGQEEDSQENHLVKYSSPRNPRTAHYLFATKRFALYLSPQARVTTSSRRSWTLQTNAKWEEHSSRPLKCIKCITQRGILILALELKTQDDAAGGGMLKAAVSTRRLPRRCTPSGALVAGD